MVVRAHDILIGLCAVASAIGDDGAHISPSHEAAAANSHNIFNAIHAVGRQWGSSLHYNGLALVPAVIPRGTLSYHGTSQPQPPTGPEWLAMEVEHAEAFALTMAWGSGPHQPREPKEKRDEQKPLVDTEAAAGSPRQDDDEIRQGYLHTYRANRNLNILYFDGMSAGKTTMGTLDTQDMLMRGISPDHHKLLPEWERADEICEIITTWGYEGFMRCEVGFEIVYCDFSNGLDQVSAVRTDLPGKQMGKPVELFQFQFVRALGEWYDGLGSSRIRFDFSSMVSGFFFPINLTSSEPETPYMPRLGTASMHEMRDIKKYLHGVSLEPRRFTVDWQGVVDMVVHRYAGRLHSMASDELSLMGFLNELEKATLLFVQAPKFSDDDLNSQTNETETALGLCIDHYLVPATMSQEEWSEQDHLIYTAIRAVTSSICDTLYSTRARLLDETQHTRDVSYRIQHEDLGKDGILQAIRLGRSTVRSLMSTLGWAEWKKVPRCPPGTVMFVPMWPWGAKADYLHPACRSPGYFDGIENNFWSPSFSL